MLWEKKKGPPCPKCGHFNTAGLSGRCCLFSKNDDGEDERKKDHAQTDRHPEKNALNAAASGENTAGVRAGETAQPCALALQDDAEDQTH